MCWHQDGSSNARHWGNGAPPNLKVFPARLQRDCEQDVMLPSGFRAICPTAGAATVGTISGLRGQGVYGEGARFASVHFPNAWRWRILTIDRGAPRPSPVDINLLQPAARTTRFLGTCGAGALPAALGAAAAGASSRSGFLVGPVIGRNKWRTREGTPLRKSLSARPHQGRGRRACEDSGVAAPEGGSCTIVRRGMRQVSRGSFKIIRRVGDGREALQGRGHKSLSSKRII